MGSDSRTARAWTWALPVAALLGLAVATTGRDGVPFIALYSVALIGAIVGSVHHAEVIAQRIGEPFGTLVLSLSITIIEVALIVTMLRWGGREHGALPRDAIFATVMIACNGLVGLSLVVGALKHHVQEFHVLGANASLATLMALTTLTLVLPTFTTSSPGRTYTDAQLLFASVASIALWLAFVFVQTVRHRDYFLPVNDPGEPDGSPLRPRALHAAISCVLLLGSLLAVVGLAHALAPSVERGLTYVGAPRGTVSIAIAFLTLMPECWAAIRAAFANRIQTSLNLSIGSALASIGLTIPAVAVSSKLLGVPLELGLGSKDLALLVLTFVVASVTLVAGRTHLLQGFVHLTIFAAFLFFSLVP